MGPGKKVQRPTRPVRVSGGQRASHNSLSRRTRRILVTLSTCMYILLCSTCMLPLLYTASYTSYSNA